VTAIYVGYLATSNNFGRYKVGKLDGDHAWIVFEETGNVEHPSLKTIIANGVVDYKSPKYELKLNGLYNTNNYGKVKVVKIVSTKEVTVEFVNTGNRVVTQKHTILAGLLTDKTAIALEQKELIEKKAEESRIQRELKATEKKLEVARLRAIADARKEEKEAEKAALREEKRKLGSDGCVFLGTTLEDRLGMKFQIIDRVDNTANWVIKYLQSGNEYTYQESVIKRGNAFDKKLSNFFDLKAAYDKKQAALYYEANRERLLQRAINYQKSNLDRARVNNQNRRARRTGAEGSHTLEETNHLLEVQDNKCACCNIELSQDNKHLDHIYPLALGGTNYIWNLQWLCQFCNNSKSATHPDEWEIYSKSEHFQQMLKSRGSTLQ
jgi:5-methylcytosine-specific restriction endonuclease McrA